MKFIIDYKNLDLRDVFKEYLKHNDLTLSHAARITKIPKTTLHDWYSGKAALSSYNKHKVKLFMEEKLLISVESIIEYMTN